MAKQKNSNRELMSGEVLKLTGLSKKERQAPFENVFDWLKQVAEVL